MKERSLFWDILKGIGIVSIVFGHCCPRGVAHYVYSYHLALFFFVSAFFYSEKKYGNNLFGYVGNLFKNNWVKYVFYSVLLILLHNFVVWKCLDVSAKYLSLNEIIENILLSFIFVGRERFAGAMWFVLPNILSCAFLAGTVTLFDRVSLFITGKEKRKIIKNILVCFFVCGAAVVGFSTKLMFNIQLSFIVLPLCVTAYFIRHYIGFNLNKYLKWYVAVLCAILSYLLLRKGLRVEMSMNIVPGIWFYILSFSGIYVCMYLSKLIAKTKFLSKFLAFCGKNSFSVMALHFFAIKFFDRIVNFVIGEKNPEVIGKWVCSYPEKLWPAYLIVGTVAPVIFAYLINKFKEYVDKRIQKNLSACVSTPTDE